MIAPYRPGLAGALLTRGPMPDLPYPYLLFLGDAPHPAYIKTALGLRDWAGQRCLGEYALPEATVSTGLARISPAEAKAAGAAAMLIGVTPPGVTLPPAWIPALKEALEAGLDLISGMHPALADAEELAQAAQASGRRLIEVRRPPENLPIATGRKRTGKRLLTVGVDCGLGKKYTALSITRAFQARGVTADFRATGQTGIMISGAGMPMDRVPGDFLAGAAELLSPDAAADHWDVIEGQGSLGHPSYAGISLGLLHGSQPDIVVVCGKLGRRTLLGMPAYPIPSLAEVIALSLAHGRLVNPQIRCAGVTLNTAAVSEADARAFMARTSAALGLPCADPIRGGAEFDRLVDACLA
jgi:uncharacterized NAD-dependent epimerase/dehydratase family protein